MLRADMIDNFLNDVQYWVSRFPEIYTSTWPLVDSIIYLLIFVGLARTVFEKRFPGQGGKAVILGVGLALTVGMVWLEIGYGFSLRSFGPLAGGLVAVVLAVMLYHVGQSLGIGKVGSYALVFFLGLPLAAQMIPEMGRVIGTATPIILLFWLASGVLSGASSFSSFKTDVSAWRLRDRKLSGRQPEETLVREELTQEVPLVQREERDVTEAYRSSSEILTILRDLRTNLRTRAASNEGRQQINEELHLLVQHEHHIRVELEDLARVVEHLFREDERIYRQVRVVLHEDPRDRKGKDLRHDIRKELTLRQALEQYRRRFLQYDKAFRQSVSWAVNELQRNRLSEAERWIDHAIRWEDKAQHILKGIHQTQKKADEALRRALVRVGAAA